MPAEIMIKTEDLDRVRESPFLKKLLDSINANL
jgi:hypothetical protein